MLQIKSVLWFLPKNLKNNVLFFTGNLLIISLQYLILLSKYHEITNISSTWFPVFLILTIIAVIYNLIFYLKHSRRLALLCVYGAKRWEVLLIVFIENILIMALSVIINTMVSWQFQWEPFILTFFFMAFLSLLSGYKFFFSDIYQLLKGGA